MKTSSIPLRLLSLLLALALALVSPCDGANYRLQSTSYAVTIQTSMESKNENCKNSFGRDSFILDMKSAKQDFDQAEFDEALTGVFFKEPNAAFFVAYGGTDVPPDAPSGNGFHYAIRTSPASAKGPAKGQAKTIDSFGKARLESYGRQAQVLCGVPIKEYQPNKAYISPEDRQAAGASGGGSAKSATAKFFKKGFFARGRLVFLLVVVGVVLFIRRKIIIDNGMGPPSASRTRPGTTAVRSLFTDAYYNVLDQKAGGNNPFDDPPSGDLAASLTEGCELSYNPAQQGLV